MEGDDDEDDIDDLEHEFGSHERREPHSFADMLSARLNIGRGPRSSISGISTPAELDAASVTAEIPLLTYGQEVPFPLSSLFL